MIGAFVDPHLANWRHPGGFPVLRADPTPPIKQPDPGDTIPDAPSDPVPEEPAPENGDVE